MPTYEIKAGLPDRPSAVTDKEAALLMPLYIGIGNLARRVSTAIGAVSYTQTELAERSQIASLHSSQVNKIYPRAIGALAFGKIVHLVLDVDKIGAEYADATNNTKPAMGIVSAPFGIADNAFGEVTLFTGYTSGISGSTVGVPYYLSTVGTVSAARPAAAGTIIQAVGFGLGTAGFYLTISSLFLQN